MRTTVDAARTRMTQERGRTARGRARGIAAEVSSISRAGGPTYQAVSAGPAEETRSAAAGFTVNSASLRIAAIFDQHPFVGVHVDHRFIPVHRGDVTRNRLVRNQSLQQGQICGTKSDTMALCLVSSFKVFSRVPSWPDSGPNPRLSAVGRWPAKSCRFRLRPNFRRAPF